MSKLRWGILGAARVNERLLPAIVEAKNAELVAIASRRAGAAAETLAKYAPLVQGVNTYDALDDLLTRREPQLRAFLLWGQHEGCFAALDISHGGHIWF